MKVLWLSNYRFTNAPMSSTGTWLKVIGNALAEKQDIELINFTNDIVGRVTVEHIGSVKQYVIPIKKRFGHNAPSNKVASEITQIIKSINPDIIHVWGTENYFGQITSNLSQEFCVLIELQGLMFQWYYQILGGLTFHKLFACTGFKEIIMPRSHLLFLRSYFKRLAIKEIEILESHVHLGIQSDWTKKSIELLGFSNLFHRSLRPLRQEFIDNIGSWKKNYNRVIFVSSSSLHPHKGMHDLLEALSILVNSGESVFLRIGGYVGTGIRQSGYERYLKRFIKRHGISESVHWLGPLTGQQIVEEIKSADTVVIPSYLESYCNFLYESISVGIPVVCTYAGAMPEAKKITDNIYFYQQGDVYSCANCIRASLDLESFPKIDRHKFVTADAAVQRQLAIYSEIISK